MPPSARAANARTRPAGARTRGTARSAAAEHSLEHRILLTATLCLLAFGAVMVYSASSAPTLLQGHGNGSSYLVKYVLFGGVGLVLMNLLARDGIKRMHRITGPLLVVSFVLVLAVYIPHVGVRVNGARRWIGSGIFQFQPSELLKIALVLYTATLLAKKPKRVLDLRELARPLLLVVGGAGLLVAMQPDLGRALTIGFPVCALLVVAGMPARNLAILAGSAFALIVFY